MYIGLQHITIKAKIKLKRTALMSYLKIQSLKKILKMMLKCFKVVLSYPKNNNYVAYFPKIKNPMLQHLYVVFYNHLSKQLIKI